MDNEKQEDIFEDNVSLQTPEIIARNFIDAVTLYVQYNTDPVDNKLLLEVVRKLKSGELTLTEDITPSLYLSKHGQSI